MRPPTSESSGRREKPLRVRIGRHAGTTTRIFCGPVLWRCQAEVTAYPAPQTQQCPDSEIANEAVPEKLAPKPRVFQASRPKRTLSASPPMYLAFAAAVAGGQVPSGSRRLRQLMAHEESSGLRTSESPASNGQELSETFGPPRKHKIHRWNCTKAQRRLGARSCSVAGRVRFDLLAWNSRGLGASCSATASLAISLSGHC